MKSFAHLLLAFFACALAATTSSAADLLLAINKGDNTLAIVDATTLKVLGTAATGPDPHEVVASSDGKLAYITNYFAGNGFANSISVVDLVTRKALPPIDIGALSRPHGITIAGGKIYFTAEGAKVVGRYDPATRKVDWVIGTGQDRTHMVIVSGDHQWEAKAEGNGPVDALYRAVDAALHGVLTGHPRLVAYDVHAVAEGPESDGS